MLWCSLGFRTFPVRFSTVRTRFGSLSFRFFIGSVPAPAVPVPGSRFGSAAFLLVGKWGTWGKWGKWGKWAASGPEQLRQAAKIGLRCRFPRALPQTTSESYKG